MSLPFQKYRTDRLGQGYLEAGFLLYRAEDTGITDAFELERASFLHLFALPSSTWKPGLFLHRGPPHPPWIIPVGFPFLWSYILPS